MYEYKEEIVIEPEAPVKPAREAKPKKGFGFKRTIALVCLSVVLGAGTLGGGVGAGIMLTRHFLPEKTQTPGAEAWPVFSYGENDVNVVPMEVKLTSFSELVKDVAQSVVSINVTGTAQGLFGIAESQGAGSGFIYDIDEEYVYVATNNHVVAGMSSVNISLDDKETVEAKIVGLDSPSDLAVIAALKKDVDALGIPYKAAKLGDSSLLAMGDQVIAMGNSLGAGQIVTYGIISAVNKQVNVEGKKLDVMRTDAAINMGNSGGPLVNSNGEVIGINTVKFFGDGIEAMGYSIPINNAKEILEGLRVDGVIRKPYIGILKPQTVNESVMAQYNLPSTGVLVSGVDENSGAAEAGLEPWDLIVGLNGEKIASAEDLAAKISTAQVGDEVRLEVYRNNEKLELTVVLGMASGEE
ncbi:MAG: trypsin-like peptidase domain-containing protein [Clostridiales bacterium]|jgi:serine protease Do|nr:trypsin-like peptidase domain-containing protein [Clostridiales bacterium]